MTATARPTNRDEDESDDDDRDSGGNGRSGYPDEDNQHGEIADEAGQASSSVMVLPGDLCAVEW